jgi:hypothetical protein
MSLTEKIRARTVSITPVQSSSVTLDLPPLDLYPDKLRKAVEQLLTVQETASTAQRAKRPDRAAVKAAEENVTTAWHDAIDVSCATTGTAKVEYEEAYAYAQQKLGRALADAADALTRMATLALLRENAIEAPSRLGVDIRSKNRAYVGIRFVAEQLEQLPVTPPIDAA